MTRAIGRASAAALLGAFAGATWLFLFYALSPGLLIDFDVTPPARLVSGVYPAERERESGLTFAWTASAMTLRLPGLDRPVDWMLTFRVRGARPVDNPELTFFVDGVRVLARASTADFETIRVPIPARPERRGATIELRSSATFVPGPSDPRPLGVMLDAVWLTPTGIVVPPRAAFAGTVLASAAFGAALALIGLTAGSAVGSIVLVSAGQAALVGRGFGAYTGYPTTLAQLASWIGLVTVVLTIGVQVLRGHSLRNTARFVVAFSASALLLKAAMLLHPDMPIGDALFHAHRFRTVADGNLYFTSMAPGNYLFPYAPGLYVFAVPFRRLLPSPTADMAMLRLIVLGAEAVAAMLLYGMIVRVRQDRLAGACAVALYQLMPLDFGVVTVGNLTNAFAQSLSVIALAVMSAGALRLERRISVLLFSGVLAAAFLSHTSTFAILLVSALAIAGLFWWRGGPALRSPAVAVFAATVLAALIAVVLYYAHFLETYRTELARIAAETASGTPAPGGRTVLDRAVAVPRYLYLFYGLPVLALSAAGATTLWRQAARDRLSLTMLGLIATCLAFLAIGVITPVDMRHYLAAIPAVALAAGIGAARGWSSAGPRRLVVFGLLAWAVTIGIHTWWTTL